MSHSPNTMAHQLTLARRGSGMFLRCAVAVKPGNHIMTDKFHSESTHDKMKIGGWTWWGRAGTSRGPRPLLPAGYSMSSDHLVKWTSDGSIKKGGWQVCQVCRHTHRTDEWSVGRATTERNRRRVLEPWW